MVYTDVPLLCMDLLVCGWFWILWLWLGLGVLWPGYMLAWVVGLPRDFVFCVCVRCLVLCLGFVMYIWFWWAG